MWHGEVIIRASLHYYSISLNSNEWLLRSCVCNFRHVEMADKNTSLAPRIPTHVTPIWYPIYPAAFRLAFIFTFYFFCPTAMMRLGYNEGIARIETYLVRPYCYISPKRQLTFEITLRLVIVSSRWKSCCYSTSFAYQSFIECFMISLLRYIDSDRKLWETALFLRQISAPNDWRWIGLFRSRRV